jgi:hypothetical protein
MLIERPYIGGLLQAQPLLGQEDARSVWHSIEAILREKLAATVRHIRCVCEYCRHWIMKPLMDCLAMTDPESPAERGPSRALNPRLSDQPGSLFLDTSKDPV